jgi:nucleotide-binding universal stress UspA family protein
MLRPGGNSQLLGGGRASASPSASAPEALPPAGPVPVRPVLLATLSSRIDPAAEEVAIGAACEIGARMIVANLLVLPPYPATVMLAREYATLPHEEDLEAVRATVRRAAARGVPTELLRISSRRPLQALIELAHERDAGLLVLGPDPRRTPRWWRSLAAARVRRRVRCLVWISPGGLTS